MALSAAAAQTAAAAPEQMSASVRRYVMCPPTYFAVTYRINPWMDPREAVDNRRAQRQWGRLHQTLVALGHDIELLTPQPDLPDMVFAANAGIIVGGRAMVPRFRHRERRAESAHYARAFAALGIAEIQQAEHVNEGEGDFRLVGERLLAGTGPRSDPASAREVSEYFGLPTVAFTLIDPRLYHLDTALAVIDERTIAYYPPAFDTASRGMLHDLHPDAIVADAEDAQSLALNLISDGHTVLMAPGHDRLAHALAERGLRVLPVDTAELRKAGGGAKCCVLERHLRSSPAGDARSREQ